LTGARADKPAGIPSLEGPSGAGVWSAPTLDVTSGVIYVLTGDNYSDPPTQTSDALLALRMRDGALLWSKQYTVADAYKQQLSTA
jgi:polyvinyl alcohol dehydrogenase (cytochrome)